MLRAKCDQCRSGFRTRYSKQRFCGDNCRKAWNSSHDKQRSHHGPPVPGELLLLDPLLPPEPMPWVPPSTALGLATYAIEKGLPVVVRPDGTVEISAAWTGGGTR